MSAPLLRGSTATTHTCHQQRAVKSLQVFYSTQPSCRERTPGHRRHSPSHWSAAPYAKHWQMYLQLAAKQKDCLLRYGDGYALDLAGVIIGSTVETSRQQVCSKTSAKTEQPTEMPAVFPLFLQVFLKALAKASELLLCS